MDISSQIISLVFCLFLTEVCVVQLLNSIWLFATPWTAAHQRPCPSLFPRACSNSRPLSWWCHPKTSSSVVPFAPCPQSFPASGSFPVKSVLRLRWPKYWSFSFTISPSSEYSGLISFKIDWTLKNTLQHHGLKASILQHSAFFMVQLSHPYMTTRKTIALTIWTFVSKVMSLLFNTLSRLVIVFLLRSKLLEFMAAVTIHSGFGAQKSKVCLLFTRGS